MEGREVNVLFLVVSQMSILAMFEPATLSRFVRLSGTKCAYSVFFKSPNESMSLRSKANGDPRSRMNA